jgi:hypothetical protein
MDKKIKTLIDSNVFHSNKITFDINVYYDDLIFDVIVDHRKLWKSSGYFDQKYYDIIIGLDNGDYEEELQEFLPLIGYTFKEFDIRYLSNEDSIDNSLAYSYLFSALKELGVDYKWQFVIGSPWLFLTFLNSDQQQLYDVGAILENEYDIDTDDIVWQFIRR